MDKKELHNLITNFKADVDAGKIHIAQHLDLKKRLEGLDFGDDGLLNPDSVAPEVLSTAKMLKNFKKEVEIPSNISILDIQKDYFQLLEMLFGNAYDMMLEKNLEPHQIARFLSGIKENVKQHNKNCSEVASKIQAFWFKYGGALKRQILDISSLKAIYAGDLFPLYGSGITSSSALYMDTLVLPDPVLSCLDLIQALPAERSLELLLKHGLTALSLKELALMEVTPPPIIICPHFYGLDPQVFDAVRSKGELALLKHYSECFGVEFINHDQLDIFLSQLKSAEDVNTRVVDLNRLVFEPELTDLSFEDRWEVVTKEYHSMEGWPSLPLGEKLKLFSIGRLLQSNEAVFKSTTLGGVPIMDVPTSWQNLLWNFEYGVSKVDPNLQADLLMINSLQDKKFQWLGNVPLAKIIELRQEGELEDLRTLLSNRILDLQNLDVNNYNQAVTEIDEELTSAFSQHASQITSARMLMGYEITRWIVTGTIGVASIVKGDPYFTGAVISSLLLGSPGATDMFCRWKELASKEKDVRSGAIGLLFNAKGEFIKQNKDEN